MTPRLKDRYRKEIIQSLMTKLNYKNINAVPKIKKIVLNFVNNYSATERLFNKPELYPISIAYKKTKNKGLEDLIEGLIADCLKKLLMIYLAKKVFPTSIATRGLL